MKFSIRDSWERIVEDNRKTYKRHNYEDIHTKIQFSSSIPKREKLMTFESLKNSKIYAHLNCIRFSIPRGNRRNRNLIEIGTGITSFWRPRRGGERGMRAQSAVGTMGRARLTGTGLRDSRGGETSAQHPNRNRRKLAKHRKRQGGKARIL